MLNICRIVYLKLSAQMFEQHIVSWIMSVAGGNMSHLTQSETLLKQEDQSFVFLKMY